MNAVNKKYIYFVASKTDKLLGSFPISEYTILVHLQRTKNGIYWDIQAMTRVFLIFDPGVSSAELLVSDNQ